MIISIIDGDIKNAIYYYNLYTDMFNKSCFDMKEYLKLAKEKSLLTMQILRNHDLNVVIFLEEQEKQNKKVNNFQQLKIGM